MAVNNSRSAGIINPAKYTGEIHIIGVGATGSRIVKNLVELGFKGSQIHVHDFDIVEEHNINNQAFDLGDIGKPKVVAMQQLVKRSYEELIHSHQQRITKANTFDLSGIVFLLTDTMKSRMEIVEAMKINPNIKLVIETRLDPQCGYVHTFNPMNNQHYNFFMDSCFDDDEAPEVVSACGTRQTIGHVVDMLSGTAMCEFVNFVNEQKIGKQVFFATQPYYFEENSM